MFVLINCVCACSIALSYQNNINNLFFEHAFLVMIARLFFSILLSTISYL